MKPSLQLKIGQSLTMTPQLQQAIRLLQLSTLDLQQEIQETIESNPMLEVLEQSEQQAEESRQSEDKSTEAGAAEKADLNEPAGQNGTDTYEGDKEGDWSENIPNELAVDSAWEDVYQSMPNTNLSAPDQGLSNFETNSSITESIQDHLHWQLNLTPMSDTDRLIAITLIDSVENDGYLNQPLDSIMESVNSEAGGNNDPEDHVIELDEVEAVLHRLQHFDPIGVCARDLGECLGIQLNQLPKDTPGLEKAKLIVADHLLLLGSRDFSQLMRRAKIKEKELQQVIELIQTLNPKPGDVISSTDPEYIIPDVVARKVNDRWQVELNPETIPKVRINATYASLVRRADNSNDNTYLRNHLQEARWFLKSLQSRNDTLLRVATKIVDVQQGFLDYGEEAMKPLVLHDIAEAVDMHESTISRVTTQKYIHTPAGVFELKYFFSSHVDTDSGMGCSSTAIRAIIKKLIAAETPRKPLSDSKIANILAEQGIKVARRTIAKYRESLMIPPSNERKKLV